MPGRWYTACQSRRLLPSEDTQPLHPGVPQNAGCTLPVLPSSLPHPRSALIAPFCVCCSVGGGRIITRITSASFRGGAADSVCICALSYSALLLMYPAPFLTHTHTQAACSQTPHGDSGNSPSDPNVTLKAEPKPTTVVCCGILWGAFRSCQFVQVRIKKTS